MKTATVAAAVALACLSGAQSRSSFFDVTDMSDIFWTPSNGELTWEIALGANPTVEYDSVTYQVTDAFGFWLLDDNDDFSATGVDQNTWEYNDKYSGTGGIAGWKTNPNDGLVPGSTPLTFNFASMTGPFENVGFHLRFTQNFANTGGLTAYVAPGASAPVPEPVTLALGAAALLAAARRRRVAR